MGALKRICDSAELKPRGSVRFSLGVAKGHFGPVQREAFVVRLDDGSVRGFHNVCPHRGQPVDVGDGRLFTPSGALECGAHGALFRPDTGDCESGPCYGRSLSKVSVEERDGAVWLVDADA